MEQIEDNDHGEMCVLNKEGDTKFLWDAKNPKEVEAAKATFDDYKKRGFAAFRMYRKKKVSEQKGEVMHEFDPKAGSIIFVPQLVGG